MIDHNPPRGRPAPTVRPPSSLLLIAIALSAFLALAFAAPGRAADELYWVNVFNNTLSRASLTSLGATDLNTGGAPVNIPVGIALDPADGRAYWINGFHGDIYSLSLDGPPDATQVDTGDLEWQSFGLALDTSRNSLYWSDYESHRILGANLDPGGGAEVLDHGPVAPHTPTAVVIEPESNTLYWGNAQGSSISSMDLDEPGTASNLPLPAANVGYVLGLAVDPEAETVYWGNLNNEIWRAKLDGSGLTRMSTAGATASLPAAFVIDRDENTLYWINYGGNKISRTDLDGGGHATDLAISGATLLNPLSLSMLRAPVPVDPPAISGTPEIGSELTCGGESWAADAPSRSIYSAPAERAYRWSRDGQAVAGATDATLVAGSMGTYSCHALASNRAGETTQESAPVEVVGWPEFSAAPAALAFGAHDVDFGPSGAQSLVVTNGGTLPLDVASVSLHGPDASDFSITYQSCGVPVPPFGGTCQVEMVFDPSTAGAKAATLTVAHSAAGDSPVSFPLSGTGVAATPLDPDPPAPDAGGSSSGGGSSPLPGSTTATPGSVATLFSSVLLADARGRVPVVLSCAGSAPCNGSLHIRTAKKVRTRGKRKRLVQLATRRYPSIPASRTGIVRVSLTKEARRVLRKLGKARVVIVVSTTGPFGLGPRRESTGVATIHAHGRRLPL